MSHHRSWFIQHWVAVGITFVIVGFNVLGTSRFASATNVAFMPGDAFFVFLLNERFLDSLPEKGGTVVLRYHTASAPFDGYYAGFNQLRIDGVPPQLVENLRRIYRDHRLIFPKIVRDGGTEMNPPIALVYNQEIDWNEQRLALKYNEDWPHWPAAAFAGQRDALDRMCPPAELYVPLVKTYDAIVEDWGNARKYKPLAVQTPKDIAWGKSRGTWIDEPVAASSKDVQFVVTTEEDLDVYFLQRSLPNGPTFYQVVADKANVCYWESDDSGEKTFVKDDIGNEGALRSVKSDRKPPMLYYGQSRENRRNGDITIPIWPHSRVHEGEPASSYGIDD
jgi:hypothetical protein